MKKLPQWETHLFNFINNNTERPFAWGKWDCCIFAVEGIKAMTGKTMMKIQWQNKKEAYKFIAKNGRTLNKVTSKYAKQSDIKTIEKNFITAGDIVLLEDHLNDNEELIGICTGNLIACVSEEGITYRENSRAKKVWRLNV
jgi:hypothetical protein